MESSYLKDYSIVQTFKENEFQKVFVGIDNRNNQPVVINTIYAFENNSSWTLVELNYKNIFSHAVHFEKRENEIILITKPKDGLSLDTYLKEHSPSFTERVNLAYEYLNSIKQYDPLPNNMKAVLVDESQIIIDDEQMSFDEMVIFNENSFHNKDFRRVVNNIVMVLKKLTNLPSINYNELSLYAQVMGFLDNLQRNTGLYNGLDEVFNEFKKLDIKYTPMPKFKSTKSQLNINDNITKSGTNSLVGRKVSSINEDALKSANSNGKLPPILAVGAAGVIVVTAGLFFSKSIFPTIKAKYLDKDIALINQVITADESKLEDEIEYVEEVENNEAEDTNQSPKDPNSNISYLSEFVEQDATTSKYSDYSLKISGENKGPHKITIDQGHIEKNSHLLMWLKLDEDTKVNIKVNGFSNDRLSFEKSIIHKPLRLNNWELLQLTLNNDIEDYVDIVFDDIEGTVWIDRIVIDMFK